MNSSIGYLLFLHTSRSRFSQLVNSHALFPWEETLRAASLWLGKIYHEMQLRLAFSTLSSWTLVALIRGNMKTATCLLSALLSLCLPLRSWTAALSSHEGQCISLHFCRTSFVLKRPKHLNKCKRANYPGCCGELTCAQESQAHRAQWIKQEQLLLWCCS